MLELLCINLESPCLCASARACASVFGAFVCLCVLVLEYA